MVVLCLFEEKNGGRGTGLNEKGAKMEKGFYINLIKEKGKKERKRDREKERKMKERMTRMV